MSLLAIEGLSVAYGATAAVRDVSLAVGPGEAVALVGGSGSGKSSIALAALGLLPPEAHAAGRVLIEGRPFAPGDRGRRIAIVLQDPATALNPALTVGRQIGETLRGGASVVSLLAQVGLDVAPSRYPHELSGGQRQRVAIAIALAGDPALIVADEPTAALDPASRAEIATLFRRLVRERGIGLLLVTHDLALAGEVADRVAVLDEGALVETGPTAERLAAPHSPALRSLVEASRLSVTHRPVAAGAPLLVLDHISRSYRAGWRGPRTHALDDISLTISPGETLGVIGASGAGKSTLARIALGLERPDRGTVTLAGIDPFAARGVERRTVARLAQAVFQDPATSFDPRHDVARIVGEPLRLLSPPLDRAGLVADALAQVGLDPAIAPRDPATLSGGQRQRVALARALIVSPRLIVLDEALSALDLRARAALVALLARLQEERGLAFLLIAHDLEVVAALAQRVVRLEAGRIGLPD